MTVDDDRQLRHIFHSSSDRVIVLLEGCLASHRRLSVETYSIWCVLFTISNERKQWDAAVV